MNFILKPIKYPGMTVYTIYDLVNQRYVFGRSDQNLTNAAFEHIKTLDSDEEIQKYFIERRKDAIPYFPEKTEKLKKGKISKDIFDDPDLAL